MYDDGVVMQVACAMTIKIPKNIPHDEHGSNHSTKPA